MKKTKSPYFNYARVSPPHREEQKNDALPHLLGGHRLFTHEFSKFVRKCRITDHRFSVLDPVTGSGTFAHLIADLSKTRGWQPRIQGMDKLANLDKVPSQSFDFVVCCFALHLFSVEPAIQLIRSMDRLAKHGWFIIDLKRSRFLTFLAETFNPWLSRRQAIGQEKTVLSTRQAFNTHEMKNLAFHAGIEDYHFKTWPYFHQIFYRVKK